LGVASEEVQILISSISSSSVLNPKSKIQNPKSKIADESNLQSHWDQSKKYAAGGSGQINNNLDAGVWSDSGSGTRRTQAKLEIERVMWLVCRESVVIGEGAIAR
jgi:hypothetical protein